MLRKSITLASCALLATGCSQSLQGLVYTRGPVPEELHYPSVQYGHIESVALIDSDGKEGAAQTYQKPTQLDLEKSSGMPKALDPRISSQLDPDDTNKADTKSSSNALDNIGTTEPKEPTAARATPLTTDPLTITKQIRQIGLYDFVCSDVATGTDCTYTPSNSDNSKADDSLKVTQTHKFRIKVRLDDGKDYWFNQVSSPNWIPQPADRVKIFFSDEPAAGVSRALRIQYSISAPANTNTPTSSQ